MARKAARKKEDKLTAQDINNSQDSLAAKAKKNSLDQSIDLGMDQFGRFLKGSWFWLLSILVLILFFTSVIKIPGVDGPTVFSMLLEIGFAILYILIQFIA